MSATAMHRLTMLTSQPRSFRAKVAGGITIKLIVVERFTVSFVG
jgi:hypothetical protein